MMAPPEDGDPRLELEELARIAGVQPSQVSVRETIRARPSKVTERIEISESSVTPARTAFLKWGSSKRLLREILLYMAFYDPEADPVPRMLGYRASDRFNAVLLEWVEGVVPDFSERGVVERVFREYGRWTGGWSTAIRRYQAGGKTALCRRRVPPELHPELVRLMDHRINERMVTEDLERVHERYEACAHLLRSTGGLEAGELFRHIARSGSAVAEAIFSSPATLTSVDLSANNVLLEGPARRPIFFDFEHGGICPAAMALGLIGDASGLVPTGSLGELAKEAFLDGWSASASLRLEREGFDRSQRCARLYFMCHDASRFFQRVLSSPGLLHKPPWRDWWSRARPDVARLASAVHQDLG